MPKDAPGGGADEAPRADPAHSPHRQPRPEDLVPSRRDFLKVGGIAAAGLVVGGGAGAAAGASIGHAVGYEEGALDYGALSPRSVPGFDHVVVLMGENRSFDNLLGWLYTPENLPEGQTFDGLAFGDYANLAPTGERIAAHTYDGPTDVIMGQPNPDPGEEFPHVNTQLFGTVIPASNASSQLGRDERAVQRTGAGHGTLDGGLRPGLLEQLRAGQRQGAVTRGRRADHGRLLSRAASRAVDAREGVRGLRRMVRGRPLADLLQPLVLPRLDLARFRHEQARRRLRQVARRRPGSDDLRPARGGRRLVEGLLRRDAARLAHRRAARPVAGEVLAHRALRAHVGVLRGRRRGTPARVRVHRAAHGLQPQRLPPPVRRLPQRARSTARRSSTPRSRTCARARSSSRASTTRSSTARRPTARTR